MRWLFLVSVALTGCATPAMRNGIAQAEFEVASAQEALTKGAENTLSRRLQRAHTVLSEWLDSYGSATRTIGDESFFPVLEAMRSEGSTLKRIKETLGGILGRSSTWEQVLSALTALLGALGVKLFLSNRRHKKEKTAMFHAIEKSGSDKLKSEIAKEVTRASAFGREVKKTTKT